MGYFNYLLVLYFFLPVGNSWNKGYLQGHWPLAAKFGTWLADSLQGSEFAYVGYNGGGGTFFMFLLLDAVFSSP
jgi:hypothetical protein